MIDRIFGNRTAQWTNSAMPSASGFAENHILMLGIPNLPDGGITALVYSPNLAGRQPDLRVAFIARHEGRRAPGSANHLSAAPRKNLNVVNRQTDRNIFERKTIAGFRWGSRSAYDFCANRQAIGSNDVTFLSVFIFQQSEASGPARIIFDRGDFSFHPMLVAFEIDQPNFLLVSAADSAAGNATVAVAPTGFLANLDEVLFRFTLGNLVKGRDRN